MEEIETPHLINMVNDPDVVMVDIRDIRERQKGHIIPLGPVVESLQRLAGLLLFGLNRSKKKKSHEEQRRSHEKSCLSITPLFLRVIASFLVTSPAIDREESVRAASLLVVKSEEGGFSDGGTQKHTLTTHFQGQDARDTNPVSSGNTKGKKGMPQADIAVALGIPQLSHVPYFEEHSVLATASVVSEEEKLSGRRGIAFRLP